MAVKTFIGHVSSELVARGSKSERIAVVLTTDGGKKYILRKQGGLAFGDNSLDTLVGKIIKAEGIVWNYLLIMSKYEILS
jgi:hypothetical protein